MCPGYTHGVSGSGGTYNIYQGDGTSDSCVLQGTATCSTWLKCDGNTVTGLNFNGNNYVCEAKTAENCDGNQITACCK
ncbi:hypothetical protein CYLTODRAFT_419159 [Cylindrobasidium torrendii FP15055 ss-10]|uniref:Uncharacterized protein n=1 Tax=Cylindrobasidium torrendii FP15055 ss-10 TaxID=1314674 RepID=A0A0D7BLR6_9AGAR|nr:hypothetical protein CYLTODRAFT_419159 [Cylindrobasidium torrendii FP15055 ss-10]